METSTFFVVNCEFRYKKLDFTIELFLAPHFFNFGIIETTMKFLHIYRSRMTVVLKYNAG